MIMYDLLLIVFGSILGMVAGIGLVLWLLKKAIEDVIGRSLW